MTETSIYSVLKLKNGKINLSLESMNAPSIPSSLVVHPAKADLLAQIQTLEAQIAVLEEEKATCQYQIDQYYRQFRLHLGDLLTQTLELQWKLSLQRSAQTGRRSDAEEAQTWRDRFEETNRAVREAVAHKPTNLDEMAERELRRLFRQAVTLAHPDRHINDPDRLTQANEYMARLNDAYQRRDLKTVRELVQDLNDGRLFIPKPETTHTLEELQQTHQRLTDRQRTLQAGINTLKADNGYPLPDSQADLMTHFSALRERMQQQINHLLQQLTSA